MKNNDKSSNLAVSANKVSIPSEIKERFNYYPENRRRPVNKVVYSNQYFQLTYNVNENVLSVSSKGDIVYSAIPYDTARNYIQRASIQFLLHPDEVQKYIEKHKANLEKYIELSILQVSGKRVDKISVEVQRAYNQIFQDPLFEIQILGRLLQHDETGPLSANLPGKFLYSENLKTGISAYLSEYLKFVVQLTHELPVALDGKYVQFLNENYAKIQKEKIINDVKEENLRFLVMQERDLEICERYSNFMDYHEAKRNGTLDKGLLELDEILEKDDDEIQNNERALSIQSDYTNERINKEMLRDSKLALEDKSDISNGIKLLPENLKNNLEIILSSDSSIVSAKPILRSEYGRELSALRKSYKAHSINPKKLEKYFENVLSTSNTNHINVVSDIHTATGKLPFSNPYFNILAGDVSDSKASDSEIKGIYVIGNHELSDVLSLENEINDQKWDQFRSTAYFKQLIIDPDKSWPYLPVGNNFFYELITETLQKRFSNMLILNNSSVIYNNVRYIGLTIPVALVERKKEVQNFIFETLKVLLDEDDSIPTVLVSHAPIFNELSMLSPKSKAYNKKYVCSDDRIISLFGRFNIVGVIHGHHHIPASLGRFKKVQFAGKEMFVVCSIYSNLNTGFELNDLLPSKVDRDNKKKLPQPKYSTNDSISDIIGLYEEKRNGKVVYRIDKIISGYRNRKSFNDKAEAIRFLNNLNGYSN